MTAPGSKKAGSRIVAVGIAAALAAVTPPGPAAAAGRAKSAPSYATVAVSATYYNASGQVVARTPVTTARIPASGPRPAGTDGDSKAADSARIHSAVTSKLAAATTCKAGKVCGTPTKSGCATWRVWRTEVHQGITDYRYEVDVHLCWSKRKIKPSSVNVSSSLSRIGAVINDNGNTQSDDGFYAYFGGLATSGHYSKYQRHVQYCAASLCYDHEDPWIHAYVHGDGTLYFHTGTYN
jgi:hypothetical protein